MKLLAALAFLGLFSANTLANGCSSIKDIAGLDSVEKQAMVVACEQKKLEAAGAVVIAPEPVTPTKVSDVLNKDTMSEISEIAKVAGQTVKEVAAELNVAVNDFIKTPVGMLTAGLAVWYVAGDTIEDVFQGFWRAVGGVIVILLATYFYRKFLFFVMLETEEKKTVKGWFGSEKEVKVPVYRSWSQINFDRGDELVAILGIGWLACVIVGVLMVFA